MRKTECLTAVLGLVFLLSACGDPTSLVAPEMPSQDVILPKAANPVVLNVTGSGSITVPAGYRRTFAFTAQRRRDGSVSGQWERVNRVDGNASGVKSHGVVTCLAIIDNVVWLGGYATSGSFTEPGNSDVAWRVADNGQGRNAPPDESSFQFVAAPTGYAAAYCDETPEAPALLPIEAGNITIR